MNSPPRAVRLHIAFFGRRNVGKSSLLNALAGQAVSIVSEQPGTTTDPVEKPMEFLPLGPVLFIDTAGLDDEGDLGRLRVARTRKVLTRTDLAVLVTEPGQWGACEEQLLAEVRAAGVPAVVALNKADLDGEASPPASLAAARVPVVRTSATERRGLGALREALLAVVPPEFTENPSILGDIVGPGQMAVLVVPIDKEAPRGRLILPQVQTIRDLLDHDSHCIVIRENGLAAVLAGLSRPPRLVVTDSQAFARVAEDTPPDVLMTSFSILFARHRGDLATQVHGATAIDSLRDGDRVLIAEACSHHPIEEDIGRVKLPAWLSEYTGASLDFQHVAGHDFTDDLGEYKLVVHCGACMINRREMLWRLRRCRAAGVPVTNYGLVIARSLGIFERALEPFPDVLRDYRKAAREQGRS